MSEMIFYALAVVLVAADVFAISLLAFWLGCKIFEVEFELKKAIAVALLVLLLKSV